MLIPRIGAKLPLLPAKFQLMILILKGLKPCVMYIRKTDLYTHY